MIGCGESKPEPEPVVAPPTSFSTESLGTPKTLAPEANNTAATPNPLIVQPQVVASQGADRAGSFDPAAVATQEEADEWLKQLNFMVGEYNGSFGKMPPDLDEFIRKGYFKNMPPAPAGKKYVLDAETKRVVLKDK
jgi:hypothetical protein